MQVERDKPRAQFLPGWRYSVYQHGVGAGLPDFSKLTPDKTGSCSGIDLATVEPSSPQNFGVVWEGQIQVNKSGLFRISTKSDDSSRVSIDGNAIVGANCSRQEKEIALTPGRHDMRVEFSQGGGDLYLTVGLDGVPPSPATDWMKTYEQAIKAQPTNYGTWLACIKTLESVKDVPAGTWLDLGRRAAHTFPAYHEAGWALTRRCLDKVLPGMTPLERVGVLLACNRELRQENGQKLVTFSYDDLLQWQTNQIGDPAVAAMYFGKLLAIHHNDNPKDNWVFEQVLNWSKNHFAAYSATAYAEFFRSQGDKVDKNLLRATLSTCIRKAGEAGDMASYRLWNRMAAQMLPPLKPGDVFLNDAQAAAAPKYAPFPGDVLSSSGLLRTSSACEHDRPLSYAQLLSGGFGGWFDTNPEEKPWAEVQVAGESLLTGIVLVNRYEFASTQDEFQWAAPLRVSVSADGKTWTEVASFDAAQDVYRVDLQQRGVRAQYVRIERIPDADKTKPPGRFHFRNFLVFGRRLR